MCLWWTAGDSNPAEILRAKQVVTPSNPAAHKLTLCVKTDKAFATPNSVCKVTQTLPLLDVFFLGGLPLSTITGGLQNQPAGIKIFLPLTYPSISKRLATPMGLEPTTSGVTGRRSHQLNYRAIYKAQKKISWDLNPQTFDPKFKRLSS